MDIDFITAGRVIFGLGKIAEFPSVVASLGKRAFLVRGKSRSHGEKFYSMLDATDLEVTEFSVSHEPEIETINQAVVLARENGCEFVISFGGGSVIDTAKTVSALLSNEGELLDYLEVVGKGQPLKNPAKNFIAIPTTAGTGSEVTKNAVISVPEKRVKVSMRSNFMLPSLALIDPQFTIGLPPEITAASGMDALIQVVEPYVCNSPNPMVDMFCRDAIPRAVKYLTNAYDEPFEQEARVQMSWVSLLGGMSLTNAKLGAVHGFAGPIGGMFDTPHGAVCAALMPAVMLVNGELLETQGTHPKITERYREIARWVTGKENALIKDAADWFHELGAKLKIQSLKTFGIQRSDFPSIIEKSKNSSSMKGNPLQLSDADLDRILNLAY
ncbi:MAG: iron-containing alcohol dehydrogenase [Chloroflexi bacterium]|nr:iron-containing alcohol dehydrogenase [Chloroflexota bacterium]